MSGDSEFARNWNTKTDEEWQLGRPEDRVKHNTSESETDDTSASEGSESSKKGDNDKDDKAEQQRTHHSTVNLLDAQEELGNSSADEGPVDVTGDDDIEATARRIRRLKKKQRQATQQKLQARRQEGIKLKAQREKKSPGKEEATGALILFAQFRQKEMESSGKDAADNLSESSMLTSSSGPTAEANQKQFAEVAQSYASEDAPDVFDDMVQFSMTISAADKKKITDDESRGLSRLLCASMRFHVRKQREILELEEHKKKSDQELEELKKGFAECDEELKKQRRQVRVLTRAVDR